MWELDHKEGWALKNRCFWTVVLEKTLENPLDCKEIQPVHPKGNKPWILSLEGLMLKLTLPQYLTTWCEDSLEDSDAGKDWGQEEKGATENEMVGWHHWLNGHESEQTPGDTEEHRSLAYCSPWDSQSQPWLSNWTTKGKNNELYCIKFKSSSSSKDTIRKMIGKLQLEENIHKT